MKLNDMRDRAHAMSRAKGWYDGDDGQRNIGEMLALIHSEVSEALECWRNQQMEMRMEAPSLGARLKPEGFPSEIADVVIRIGDLCGYLGIDLEHAIETKMAYNATRTHRHGGKIA